MSDPEVMESWDEYLTDFDKDVWPVMERHGYTKGQAFHMWMLNRIANAVELLADIATRDEDEEWKG